MRTKSWAAVAAAGMAITLTGCAGFFVPVTSASTTVTNTGDYVYVANPGLNTVTGYVIGTNTLTAVASSYTTVGNAPQAVAVSRANTYVYVATLNGIYGYAIGTSGVLTTLAGGAALATASDLSLDTSPDGQWLFGLNSLTLTVDEFGINTSTGALTVQTGSNYVTPTGLTVVPTQIKVSPEGNYVVAALGTAGFVVYPLVESTGVLSAGKQVYFNITTLSFNGIAIDPTDTYLYVSQSGIANGATAAGILSYNLPNVVNGSESAALNALVAAGTAPGPLILNAAGNYLYVGNRSDSTISGYSVATGTVTALTGSPYSATAAVIPRSFAIDRTGSYFLEGTAANPTDLSLFSFDASTGGKLDTQAQVSTGTDSIGAAIATTH